MFARVSALLLVVPLLISATAVPRGNGYGHGGTPTSECNTENIKCCNSIQDSRSSEVQTLIGLLGFALGSVTGQVGVTCAPLSVLGDGRNSCTSQPACCTGNNYNGVINLGCTPINLSL